MPSDTRPHARLIFATVEEVAAELSAEEGREVTVQEVRAIEARALRKLRSEFYRRGLRFADVLPDGGTAGIHVLHVEQGILET